MDKVIQHLNTAKKHINNAKKICKGKSSNGGGGFLGKLTGFAGDGINTLISTGANIRDGARDRLVDGWNALPGNEFVEDKAGDIIDKLPFNNTIETALRALAGQGEIALDTDAIALIQTDPAMQAYEESIVSAIQADPRYGNEAFNYQVDQGVEFGGQRAPGSMFDQIKDPLNPQYRDTWKAAGNELTWLLRHANVNAVAEVDLDGTINITYSLNDVLDLSPEEGRSNAYNKITGTLGTVWHDILGAEESTITANWTSER